MMVPSGLRSLLTTGPGPDDGGSRLNQRPQIPDKSGMDTPVFASRSGRSVGGVNVCACAGVKAAAAVDMISKREPRRLCIPASAHGLLPIVLLEIAQIGRRLVLLGRHQVAVAAEEIVLLADADMIIALAADHVGKPDRFVADHAPVGLIDDPRPGQRMVDGGD